MLALAGCGGSATPPTPSPTPTVVDSCAGAGSRWHAVPDLQLDAAQLGFGPAVVFGNDSGNSACDWLPLAGRFAAAGFRAVVFTYFDSTESRSATEMLALARTASGSRRFALIGASVGGRLVIEAAARHPAGLAAIVSLSGERELPSYPDILPLARRVNAPTLYVGSTADTYTDGIRQQRQLHHAMHGHPNDILQLAGIAHGTELLDQSGPDGTSVRDHILAFIRAQLRPG